MVCPYYTMRDSQQASVFILQAQTCPLELMNESTSTGTQNPTAVARFHHDRLVFPTEAYVHKLNLKHWGMTPFHPRTNGKVESFNGVLGRILMKYLIGKSRKLWDRYLD